MASINYAQQQQQKRLPIDSDKKAKTPKKNCSNIGHNRLLTTFFPKSFQLINVYAAPLGFFMPPLRVFCAPLVILATG